MPEQLKITDDEQQVATLAEDEALHDQANPTPQPHLMSYAARMALKEGFVSSGPAGF